jgi:hypothetical protein
VVVPASIGGQPRTTLTAAEQQLLAGSTTTSRLNMSGAAAGLVGGRRGLFSSVRVGFDLLPVSWSVIAAQPSLLMVPLIVLLSSVIAVVGYVGAFGGVSGLVGPNDFVATLKVFPLVAFVCTASVVGQAVVTVAASDALDGRRDTLGAAWLTTAGQLPRLVAFGVVYAAERTVTSLLRNRSRLLGRLAADLVDRAWDFAVFLAIPVLLYEDLPVFRAVQRSGKLVASRWGTQFTARSVLNLALFVLMLPLMIIGVLVTLRSELLGVTFLIAALMGVVALSGALTGVLSAALYRYATTGAVAPGFREDEMWSVFSRR